MRVSSYQFFKLVLFLESQILEIFLVFFWSFWNRNFLNSLYMSNSAQNLYSDTSKLYNMITICKTILPLCFINKFSALLKMKLRIGGPLIPSSNFCEGELLANQKHVRYFAFKGMRNPTKDFLYLYHNYHLWYSNYFI